MARSPLLNPTEDLISDSGSILWSLVKGEQLEFPIILNFIKDVTNGYIFEAVVVEGLNTEKQDSPPITIQPNGVQDTLSVRLPNKRGTWNPALAYTKGDVVLYEGVYYELLSGVSITDTTTPDIDVYWEATTMSKLYVQFPADLGSDWGIAAEVGFSVYGFFELRVTEPTQGDLFVRSWKPVRGMVQLLFSPTELVPDV